MHSSMIFFTSPSSRLELSDLEVSAEDSDLNRLDEIILLESMSCCGEVRGVTGVTGVSQSVSDPGASL